LILLRAATPADACHACRYAAADIAPRFRTLLRHATMLPCRCCFISPRRQLCAAMPLLLMPLRHTITPLMPLYFAYATAADAYLMPPLSPRYFR